MEGRFNTGYELRQYFLHLNEEYFGGRLHDYRVRNVSHGADERYWIELDHLLVPYRAHQS